MRPANAPTPATDEDFEHFEDTLEALHNLDLDWMKKVN